VGRYLLPSRPGPWTAHLAAGEDGEDDPPSAPGPDNTAQAGGGEDGELGAVYETLAGKWVSDDFGGLTYEFFKDHTYAISRDGRGAIYKKGLGYKVVSPTSLWMQGANGPDATMEMQLTAEALVLTTQVVSNNKDISGMKVTLKFKRPGAGGGKEPAAGPKEPPPSQPSQERPTRPKSPPPRRR
jgi:hypothetical protein